jgi:predicted translin family RNA/ssDNA-binding protein
VSPGVQEYIEALGLAHYFEHEALVSFADVERTLADADGAVRAPRPRPAPRADVPARQFFPLTAEDYLLGLSDLTGECMRYAIGAIPRRGGRARASALCAFVRACKAGARAPCLGRGTRWR